MPAWLLRGLVLAVVHAVAGVGVAWVNVFHRDSQTVVTSVVFAVVLGVALSWGAVDGWLRAPERGRTWLLAALTAGPVAGVAYVIGRAAFFDQTGVSALGVQLTSGAAFTVLLVIVPAGLGLFVGRRLSPDPAAVERSDNVDAGDADGDMVAEAAAAAADPARTSRARERVRQRRERAVTRARTPTGKRPR